MRTWQIRQFGLNALEQVEIPIPAPGPHELLVRVGAASLNYRDRLVIEGTFIPDLALPFVPASDAAGEIAAVGDDVTRFHVGDRVVGTYIPPWIDGDGGGAEPDCVSRRDPLPGVLSKYAILSRGGPLPGVLSEYVIFDEEGVVETPSYLNDREASSEGH